MVRTMVTTHGWARLGTRVSRLVMKWVRHRCQLAPPKTAASAKVGSYVCVGSRLIYSSESARYAFRRWSPGVGDECMVMWAPGKYEAVYKSEVLLQVRSSVKEFRMSRWVPKAHPTTLKVPEIAEGDPGVRLHFEGWTAGETPFSPINTIAPLSPSVIEVKWTKEYYLEVNGPEGSVPFGSGWYPAGATVVLKAIPTLDTSSESERLGFARWAAAGIPSIIIPNAQASTTQMTVDAPRTIEATYQKEYLVVVQNPQGTLKKTWVAEGQQIDVETPPLIETVAGPGAVPFPGMGRRIASVP